MPFPRLFLVRQRFPDRRIPDVAAEVQRQLHDSGFAARLKPGARVAIGVGSRGIATSPPSARGRRLLEIAGHAPVHLPGHGQPRRGHRGRPGGRAGALRHHEATMGCPVVSSLDVVRWANADGIETFMDRNAFESDGVMLVGRVKWHTDFMGKIESGLFKMIAIGLGKFAGAQHYHTYAYKLGLENTIRGHRPHGARIGQGHGRPGHSGRRQSQYGQNRSGAGGRHGAARRRTAGAGQIAGWASIPMDLDILIVDEIGKNVSGAGMDTKVVNRSVLGDYNPWPDAPRIERIFVRDLSDYLQQRGGRGHGRRGDGPAGEPHRLGAHAGEFADRLHAFGHPHADPLPDRPRVPGSHRAHGGQVRSAAKSPSDGSAIRWNSRSLP